jgi:hypothetical protein
LGAILAGFTDIIVLRVPYILIAFFAIGVGIREGHNHRI